VELEVVAPSGEPAVEGPAIVAVAAAAAALAAVLVAVAVLDFDIVLVVVLSCFYYSLSSFPPASM